MNYRIFSIIVVLNIAHSIANAQVVNVPDDALVPPGATYLYTYPSNYPTGTKVNWHRVVSLEQAITDTSLISTIDQGDVHMSTSYTDGLDRPIQTVVRQTSPTSDLVSIALYDSFGRAPIQFLPYGSTSISSYSRFKKDAFTGQPVYYATNFPNDQAPYSTTTFDDLSAYRAVTRMKPGASYAGSQIGKTTRIFSCKAAENIRIWNFSAYGIVPTTSASWSEAMLTVNETTDEAGMSSRIYKDKEGKTIFTKIQSDAGAGSGYTGWICTYYIYDSMDRLRIIVPPKAVDYLSSHSWVFSSSVNDELCYSYDYDYLGRVIQKKIPGRSAINILYDSLNRPVLFQDGVLAASNQWMFVKFDINDRPILSGKFLNSGAYSSTILTSNLNGTSSIPFITFLNSPVIQNNYDSSSSIPDAELYNIMYYDNYSKVPGYLSYSASIMSLLPDGVNAETPVLTNEIGTMKTGEFARVMDGNSITSQWLSNAIYYNPKGRVIQVQDHNYKGGFDTLISKYDFAGSVLTSLSSVNNPQAWDSTMIPHFRILKTYRYDDNKRLIATFQKLNNDANFRQVNSFSFNNVGQLIAKNYGSIERQNYTYRIWGDLESVNKVFCSTGANNNYYGEIISYDYGFSSMPMTDLPAGLNWRLKGSSTKQRAYGYSYDNVGRLNVGYYSQRVGTGSAPGTIWTNSTENYTAENMTYDLNSNLLSMQQWGTKTGYSAPFIMDNLTYHYNNGGESNKLSAVDDAISTNYGLGEFYQYSGATTVDYNYDANGNVISDANKNISNISYNFENKPYRIDFTGGRSITFTYDANGVLLNKKISESGYSDRNISYIDNLEYQNDWLTYVAFDEGRLRPIPLVNTTTHDTTMFYEYDYYIKDHKNNVRSVVTESVDSNWSTPTSILIAGRMSNGDNGYTSTSYNPNEDLQYDPASFTVGTRTYVLTNELNQAAQENAIFSNVDSTRSDKPGATDSSDVKSALLNPAYNKLIGPTIVLRVMAGDSIGIETQSFYQSGQQDTGYATTDQLVTGLLTAISGDGLYNSINEGGLDVTSVGDALLQDKFLAAIEAKKAAANQNMPQAFLNYIMLDENLQLIPESSGFVQTRGPDNWDKLTVDLFQVRDNGFIFIFPSNESSIDVHFDNLSVTHFKGGLQAENHYYPYGLTITTNAVTSAGKNDILYQSNKLHSGEFSDGFGLNWYQYGARFYDPQIGRWHVSDPLTERQESFSPYHYCFSNPVVFSDPSGLYPMSKNAQVPDRDARAQLMANGFGFLFGLGSGGGAGGGSGGGYDGAYWADNMSASLNWTNGWDMTNLIARNGGITSRGGDQYVGNVPLMDFLASTLSGYSDFGAGLAASLGPNLGSFLAKTNIHQVTGRGWGYWTDANKGTPIDIDAQHYQGGGGTQSTDLTAAGWGVTSKWNPINAQSQAWTEDAERKNTAFSLTAAALEQAGKTVSVGIFTTRPAIKLYNNWHGNQYVKVFNLGKVARIAGWGGLGFGTYCDLRGVWNYYTPSDDPEITENRVSPGKASVNFLFGYYGMKGGLGGLIGSSIYFGVDAFYPGGWPNAMEDQKNLTNENRAIIPNWDLHVKEY